MKKENLIVGQWYRITNGKSTSIGNDIWYGKYLKLEKGVIHTSNHIHSKFTDCEGNFGQPGQYTFTPIPISEIEHLLPEEHPDKIKRIDDLEPLIKLLKQI